MKKLFASLVLGFSMLGGTVQATTVTADLNVDNGYFLYLSTDDASEGSYVGQGKNWLVTRTHTGSLVSGVTNYLHIIAFDEGGLAGLLGEFSLSDAGFEFANGSQTLLSGEAGLRVSESGWGSYGATTSVGANGTAPWGNRSGVSPNASWVWSDDAVNDNRVYFSAAINPTVVPLPGALPLLVVALGGLGFASRLKKSSC